MSLPRLHFRTDGLGSDEAFERWRALIAPMYTVARARGSGRPPMGEVTAILFGDILANRTIFEAQHVSRDKTLIGRTPDHVVFQFWRTGGYNGEIAGRSVAYGGGLVRFVDTRRVLAGRFTRSDTLGFTIPRSLIHGIDPERVSTILDPQRNRLAVAKISGLYRRLSHMEAAQVPAATAEFLAFLRRLFDPSRAPDVLVGSEFDESLLQMAEGVVLAFIGSSELTPDFLAARLGISRATLYRLYAPLGGVMRHITEQRLLALRAMLADPLERRSLTRLAEDFGFSSLPVLSRTFRARFGEAPRDWRQRHVAVPGHTSAIEPIMSWWFGLGRGAPERMEAAE